MTPAKFHSPAVVILLALAAAGAGRSRAGEPQPDNKPPALTRAGPEEARDYQRRSLSLGGEWEYVANQGDQELWRDDLAAKESWRKTTVPGSLDERTASVQAACYWLRKIARLDGAQAASGAVLKSNGIRFGATVWLNGRQIGQNATMRPCTLLVPPGLPHNGENTVLLKITAWAGLARSASGFPLIPTGSGTQDWGNKTPGIYDALWLEFYDRVYLQNVLALPDLTAKKVSFRVGFAGSEKLPEQVDVSAVVEPAAGGGDFKASATFKPGPDSATLEVPIKDVTAWTPATPNLYKATLTASTGGKLCDKVSFFFGMRQIDVREGHYQLNGQPLWLRGSNLVGEWGWLRVAAAGPKEYIVDEARAMNLNCFRTHTINPPTNWLDIADAHGTMILAEMPVLYNYQDFKFTPAEFEIWHRHVLSDTANWITKNWNHPAIVMWVLSNESRRDNAWESGPYWQRVRELDPTRPTLRTGEPAKGTGETVDIHTCDNITLPVEGAYLREYEKYAKKKDPARTLNNTEYMNVFRNVTAQWVGGQDQPEAKLYFAEFGMEHTEAMRRLNYDCILPYMYAGWTRTRGNSWREDYPTAMAAALHSSMAPVLASLDLFDRNFTAGRSVTTPALLINELGEDVSAKLEVYVTPQNPLFVPDEEALKAAVQKETVEVVFKARANLPRPITWKVPDKEGTYYLALVVRRPGDRPVVSQRTVRAIKPAPAAAAGTKIVLVGAGVGLAKWLKAHNISPIGDVPAIPAPDSRIALVWDEGPGAAGLEEHAPALLHFAKAGGRVVVLSRNRELLKALANLEADGSGFIDADTANWTTQRIASGSRAFVYDGAAHRMLEGLDREWLKRWNGLPGALSRGFFKSPLPEGAKPLLWIQDPPKPVAFSLPAGQGEMVFCLLMIPSRIGQDGQATDPAAERILANLLK